MIPLDVSLNQPRSDAVILILLNVSLLADVRMYNNIDFGKTDIHKVSYNCKYKHITLKK